MQLKISKKNVLLFICELSWWLGQNCCPCLLEIMGKSFRVVGRVAVKKTYCTNYKCKFSHKLPLFDQCQYFWFCTAHTFIFHLPTSDTHTHTINCLILNTVTKLLH